jgi:uncharacterized protein (TIGR03790 family)
MKSFIRRFSAVCLGLTFATNYVSAANYSDVAVIVNSNSTTSKAIAAYFQAKRGIPAANMIYVTAPEQEVITNADFAALRTQIESYITAHGLTNSINYIVTTKGLPLKINREANGADPFSTSATSASLESELTLILGSYSGNIAGAGGYLSPYWRKTDHFSRAKYGIYLVTRLDGYTQQDVLNLIDKAAPGMTPDPHATFLFDEDPVFNSSVAYLNTNMETAVNTLNGRGKITKLNKDTVFVTNSANLMGYASWGSNDHYAKYFATNAIPNNTWASGAIAETYVSTSGRSFAPGTGYGQSLIADLISEGISGVKGYVYEPYSGAMANVGLLFDAYTNGFNLAESFYQASAYLSWMDVIIGDPKVSIDGTTPLPITLASFTATPSQGSVVINWNTVSEVNNYGFTVQRRAEGTSDFADVQGSFIAGNGTTLEAHSYSWSDRSAAPGRYEYRLKQVDLDGTVNYSEPVKAEVSGTTSVTENAVARTFALGQNYPNPFNPTTRIAYVIPSGAGSGLQVAGSGVKLTIYDMLGREVAVLVDGAQEPGRHEVAFDARGLASGTYLYRLEAGSYSETKRMILVR